MEIEKKTTRYQSIWVVADQTNGELNEVTLEMLGEGRTLADKLGAELSCILLGSNVSGLANSLASGGFDKIYLVDHPTLSQYSTDTCTAVLISVIKQYTPSIVMIGGTTNGRDMAPRIAARLKVGLMSNCVQLKINKSGTLEATKPIYSGKFYATITLPTSNPHLATIIPGSIGVGSAEKSRGAPVIAVDPKIDSLAGRTKVENIIKVDPRQLDIREAEIVVSGGRGVGGTAKWPVIESLADALGAGIGGSRAALDMGCITRENMLGQTGKAITPKLYFGVGISGSSQHLAGIKGSKFIIAVNSDRFAPIFKSSNAAIVADLHEVIPAIVKELGKHKIIQ